MAECRICIRCTIRDEPSASHRVLNKLQMAIHLPFMAVREREEKKMANRGRIDRRIDRYRDRRTHLYP